MYTEPTPVSGYVEATFTSHPSLMRYVTGWGDPSAFTRVGPNFTFFVAKKPVSQLLDCDIIPADKNNVLRTATAVDRGARTCLKPTEYNAWIRMKGAREAFLKAHADELNDKAEQALDVVLNASTNTLALATDNVLTRKLLVKAMAMISKYGGSRNGMVLVTSNEDVVAELFDSGVLQVTPPLAQLGDLEDVVAYFGNVPIVISNNFTNSTATGGTAAYLWARGAITGGFDDLDSQIYNVKNPSTGTYDITSTIAYAFLETEQTGDKRLVRFINP